MKYINLQLNHVTVASINESIFVLSISLHTNKFRHMKKVLFFAASAIIFASCGNQEATEQANQAKIDSMSQELARQHIIDSMNAAMTAGGGVVEIQNPPMQSSGSSYEPRRSGSSRSSRNTQSNNSEPVGSAPVSAAPSAVSNTPTGPTAAEIEAKRKADNRKKAKSAAVGAAVGAGAGAAAGAISGKNAHFKKENALIGAGVGAAVAAWCVRDASAGLLLQNRKQKKERERDTTQD